MASGDRDRGSSRPRSRTDEFESCLSPGCRLVRPTPRVGGVSGSLPFWQVDLGRVCIWPGSSTLRSPTGAGERDRSLGSTLSDSVAGAPPRAGSDSARDSTAGIALTTRGLTKSYGGVTVLQAADLDVHSGSLVSILGPSGSGKTTLLQCIAGFVQPDAGTVRVGGHDVTWAPPHKRNLGLVFQSHALFGHMSVLDNGRVRIADAQTEPGERAQRSSRRAAAGSPRGLRGSLSAPALGRSTAARRAGARSGHLTLGTPSRRTSQQPRSGRSAMSCARRSDACSSRSRHQPSSSPTTRRRRWRYPTAWP